MHVQPVFAVQLDGRPGSVRAAREGTRRFLRDLAHDGPGLREETQQDAVLVVSELVSNACRHAPGRCRLTVAVGERTVDIAVEDTSHLPPTPRTPDPTGYGLRVVTALARSFQVEHTRSGKIVYATVVDQLAGPGE